jgi:hypothetical protein
MAQSTLDISIFLRSDIPNGLNKSYVYVLKQSHTTLDFIDLFMATCFGSKCEPTSGLL